MQVSPDEFAVYLGDSNVFSSRPRGKTMLRFLAISSRQCGLPLPTERRFTVLIQRASRLPPLRSGGPPRLAHPVLRARYADLLWEFQKQVDGTKPPLQDAQTAMDAYLAAAAQVGAASHEVVVWLNRAISIATSVSDQTRLAADVQQAIAWVQNTQGAQNARSCVFLFEAIYDNRRVAGPEKAAIIAYLESVLTARTNQSGTTFDFDTAEIVADLLATHFRRSNNKADEERVIHAAGLATEFAVSQASELFAMTWLQKLLERYRSFGMNADADRVQVKARRHGMDSGEEMKKRAYTFTIPEERLPPTVPG